MSETVGGRLKRLRLELGLTQRELAVPGATFAFISRIEAGERCPSVKALRLLAPRLGVSVAYLETGSDDLADALREIAAARARLQDAGCAPARDAARRLRRAERILGGK